MFYVASISVRKHVISWCSLLYDSYVVFIGKRLNRNVHCEKTGGIVLGVIYVPEIHACRKLSPCWKNYYIFRTKYLKTLSWSQDNFIKNIFKVKKTLRISILRSSKYIRSKHFSFRNGYFKITSFQGFFISIC